MLKRKLLNLFANRGGRPRPSRRARLGEFTGLEPLDRRIVPAITAGFQNGVLTVLGDAIDNTIIVGRDTAGNILVNGYLAGFGMTIGTVFGRIAGEEAARHAVR